MLISTYDNAVRRLEALAPAVLPTLARLIFAAVLLGYFWSSARTKLAGPFTPSDGAYIQIFPRVVENLGYDFGKLSWFHWAVVLAGSWAELVLPLLIVAGLFTRLAALAMIGFVIVQSATDVIGHGVGGDDLGAWFDAASGSLIMDQRALWVGLLVVLVMGGGGPVALDRAVASLRAKE